MKSKKWALLGIAVFLTLLSLLELSAISPFLFKKQLIFFGLSLIVFLITSRLPLKFWKSITVLLFLTSLLLLIFVFLKGKTGGGARRWIHLGFFNFQPSEFAKIAFIFILASFYQRHSDTKSFFKAGFLALFPMALIAIEPDLATSLSIFFIYIIVSIALIKDLFWVLFFFLMPLAFAFSFAKITFIVFLVFLTFFVLILRLKYSLALLLLFSSVFVGLFSPIAVNKFLKKYQRDRIVAFLNPEKYRHGPGWQTIQAKIALGSAGILGKGYKKGTQKGLAFLPAAHTDFIFSSIGEEFGFVSTSTVTILFLIFIFLLFSLAQNVESRYAVGLLTGVGAYFFYHVITNIATNLGLFPVAGIPLPFMSYGGTHLLTEYFMLGLVFRVVREASELKFIW